MQIATVHKNLFCVIFKVPEVSSPQTFRESIRNPPRLETVFNFSTLVSALKQTIPSVQKETNNSHDTENTMQLSAVRPRDARLRLSGPLFAKDPRVQRNLVAITLSLSNRPTGSSLLHALGFKPLCTFVGETIALFGRALGAARARFARFRPERSVFRVSSLLIARFLFPAAF